MQLLDVLHSPWAIQPAKLLEIAAIYTTHLRGDKIDIPSVEARLGRSLKNEPKPYDVVDGVAIIHIEGVIAKRASLFMDISGGASTEYVARDLRAAVDDPEVGSIILYIDSPGGTVDGTQSLADQILGAREKKPIVALASGVMASAAYWIGSAAQEVYIVDGTTLVGSIGVVSTHVDVSKAEEQRGYKTTEIVAGKFKRIASQYGALTEAGRATIQEQVDYTYSLFVGAVAKQRGVDEDKVLKDMADGRVFMGQQAIDAGLVDGVSTLDALISKLSSGAGVAPLRNSGAGAALQTSHSATSGETMPLTAEQVQAGLKEHPAIAQALRDEGQAAGVTAERARILGIQALSKVGHEALIASCITEGKSVGDAAVAIVQADKKVLEGQAAALKNDAQGANGIPAGSSPKPDADKEPKALSREELHTKATALAAEKNISYIDAVRQLEKKGA